MTIGDLEVGAVARVIGFSKGSSQYRSRLLAMGVTMGESVQIRRVAPMGDPVELLLKGFALVLRKDEAATVLVERM
ncbi:MAG: ferrous iron transport protein A [Magnetococcales bacterium]|nr:ferrous iron transport protein A [Magnetococcales bacterium]MBF0114217.1 ferrous iron transport protein A [Magnetococcales bacterium]